MLLVACAFGPTAGMIAACGSGKSGCMGFYASDASFDVTPLEDQSSGCLGFYACDAYGSQCNAPDAGDADVTATMDADADASAGDERE